MTNKSSGRSLKFGVLIIGMIAGAGLIIFDQQEFIFGSLSVAPIPSLSILDVPIDPTTGGILGTIVLGAPDVAIFEQAGTMIGIPRTSTNFPRSPCTDNLTGGNMFPFLAPDFGRRLSGERNQVDPVWWGSTDTGVTNTRDCAFAYAQFDIVDIPNDFVATSVVLKLEILETRGIRNTNNPSQECTITIQDFNLDTISDQGVIDQLYAGFPVVARGTWCNSLGVKTFQFNQGGVDVVNDAIKSFSGVRSDKLLLGFLPRLFDNLGTGQNRLSTDYWATQGSLFLTGSSPPINCGLGLEQVGFRCIPIDCDEGMQVNATNMCEPITCAFDEQLIGDICTPVICNVGETVTSGSCVPIVCNSSDELVGSECIPLICDVGFEAVNNECVVKTCGIGMELVADSCQAIVCQSDFVLVGSDCLPKECPSSELSYNNECRSTKELCDLGILTCDPIDPPILECPTGFNQVGASCVLAPENCPEGTVANLNVCVQVIPNLMISGAPQFGLPTILGIILFAGSFFGIAGMLIRNGR